MAVNATIAEVKTNTSFRAIFILTLSFVSVA